MAAMRAACRRRPPLPAGFLEAVDRRVGARGWSVDPERLAPHAAEQWGTARGRSPLLLRPATTVQVAAVLELCHARGVPVVPQGGNTGLVGAGVPDASGRLVVLSLASPEPDPRGRSARTTRSRPRPAACSRPSSRPRPRSNRLFPLALGAQGSCQIGGNLSSNAGGVNVLRYGMARSLVLGLEVVLADGRIWDGLRSLRKDNTGYDLKQLFIGAEGTLGVITAAVLRLLPRPRERQTAWLAVALARAPRSSLLALFRDRLGETVSSFELLAGGCVELVLRYLPGARAPLARPRALVRARRGRLVARRGAWRRSSSACWRKRSRRGLIADGVIAASEAQRQALLGAAREPDRGDGARGSGAAPRHRGAGRARART